MKSIAKYLLNFRRNDARALDLFNTALEQNSYSKMYKAAKLAPHVQMYWVELIKRFQNKLAFRDKASSHVYLIPDKKDPLARERNDFYQTKELFRKKLKLEYFNPEDLLTQIISFIVIVSDYFKGNQLDPKKKDLIKGLSDIQLVLEHVSLISELVYLHIEFDFTFKNI